MSEHSIYQDIALRTGGDIYIGVVGPVRTGKSTFIKMLFREILPTSGILTVNGRDVIRMARSEVPGAYGDSLSNEWRWVY